MSASRSKKTTGFHSGYSDPRCWWCEESIKIDCEWRGDDKNMGLPIGSGVVVCGPRCKGKPDDSFIYTHATLLRG